jgi:hypothetical protein
MQPLAYDLGHINAACVNFNVDILVASIQRLVILVYE